MSNFIKDNSNQSFGAAQSQTFNTSHVSNIMDDDTEFNRYVNGSQDPNHSLVHLPGQHRSTHIPDHLHSIPDTHSNRNGYNPSANQTVSMKHSAQTLAPRLSQSNASNFLSPEYSSELGTGLVHHHTGTTAASVSAYGFDQDSRTQYSRTISPAEYPLNRASGYGTSRANDAVSNNIHRRRPSLPAIFSGSWTQKHRSKQLRTFSDRDLNALAYGREHTTAREPIQHTHKSFDHLPNNQAYPDSRHSTGAERVASARNQYPPSRLFFAKRFYRWLLLTGRDRQIVQHGGSADSVQPPGGAFFGDPGLPSQSVVSGFVGAMRQGPGAHEVVKNYERFPSEFMYFMFGGRLVASSKAVYSLGVLFFILLAGSLFFGFV